MYITSKYSKIVYDEKDQSLAHLINDYLNDHCEEIYDFFDPNLNRKSIDINIMNKDEYDVLFEAKYKRKAPKWSVGFYDGYLINYVSLNDYKNTSHNIDNYEEARSYYLKTIVHEYTHYVTSLYCIKNRLNKPIKYLSEGIAQILSGQRDNDQLIFNYETSDILDSNNNYGAWYMMTKYILEVKGKDCFFELLSNEAKATDFVHKEINNVKDHYNLQKKHSMI